MNLTNDGPRMLAIGLDAMEPTLVQRMIDKGRLPALKRLLSKGQWLRVESSARLGSGSVWPTFITGTEATVHGVYGEWLWDAGTMSINRYNGSNLNPFWKELNNEGMSVGVFDVPFMPMVDVSGFEISEWGGHDIITGRTEVRPPSAHAIVSQLPPNPLSQGTPADGPQDYEQLRRLGKSCLQGARLRGELAQRLLKEINPNLFLMAFTEIHRAAHHLWHKVEPDDPTYSKELFKSAATTEPTFEDIYCEVDRQIGELVKIAGEETPVMVFSLHGMKPAHGLPGFLPALLCEMGFAKLAAWGSQSWRHRATAFAKKVKQLSPPRIKKIYYKLLPVTAAQRLARPTMLSLYDWSQTRAFSLPSDQHGWVRINLAGREASGIVAPEAYEETCSELEERLRNLKSQSGRPLVRDVMRMAKSVETALVQDVPDIVVHWDDAIFEPHLRILGSAVEAEMIGTKFVSQHSLEGFCILKSGQDVSLTDVIQSKDLGKLITKLLTHPAKATENNESHVAVSA